MAAHNQALITARQALMTATAAGDDAEISKARTQLAAVMTARYNKASSIPELRKLIEEWEAAANRTPVDAKPATKAGSDVLQILTMLEQLQSQLGK